MAVSGTNFGKAARDYGTFRAGFPESIFDRLAEFNVGQSDQTVIDLGTGTGTLARNFALRGCEVIGVDPDPRMIGEAKKLDRQERISIRYVEAKAESTGLDSSAADVGMYPQYLPVLSEAGMQDIQTFSYDMDVPYTPEAWRGRIRASAGVAALDSESALNFDADLMALISNQFPSSVLAVPHRIFAIVADAINAGQ